MRINVKFTDSDTVLFSDNRMITSDYFNFLNTNINDGKVTNFNYDATTQTFSYQYDCDSYYIKVDKYSPLKLKTLFSLMFLEKNMHMVIETKQEEEARKRSLIEKAKNGDIVSEEAKKLYVEELKKQRKELITGISDIIENPVIDPEELESEHGSVLVLVDFGISGVVAISLIDYSEIGTIIKILLGLASLLFITLIETLGFDIVPFRLRLYVKIFNALAIPFRVIGNFLRDAKRILSSLKVINHEIKYLKKYHAPSDEDKVLDIKTRNNLIDGYYASIATGLIRLDDDKKDELVREFVDKFKEYMKQKDEANNSTGLIIKDSQYYTRDFVSYLADFETRVYDLINNKDSIESSIERGANKIAPVDHSMDLVSDVKVRKLENSSMAMPM